MEHTGDGTIIDFNSFTTIEGGTPRYTLQIGRSGDYLYWNGTAWVVSDGSYAQSTDETTFNANVGSLPVSGEKYGQFKIHFTDTNTQSYVDKLTANMRVNNGYLTTNPTIEPTGSFEMDGLEGFVETATKSGSDEIKYILKKDNTWYYHNGTSWVVSNQSYSQSNTAVEIQTYKGSFTSTGISFKWRGFLHSGDGTDTPELDSLTISYDFFSSGESLNKCVVWGYAYDAEGDPSDDNIIIKLNAGVVKYKTETTIVNETITITPNSNNGYWEVELVENDNMANSVKYIFNFGKNGVFVRTVPNAASKNFYDLI
jgi:hypothetical protein